MSELDTDKPPSLTLLQQIAESTEGTEEGLLNAGIFARALTAAGRPAEAAAALT